MDKITIERETLLPCPFCGNDKNIKITNERHDNSGGYFIDCPECHASTGLRFAAGDDPIPLLVEQWNRRAALEAQPADAQQKPVAWRHSKTGRLYDSAEEAPLADGDEWAEPLYLAAPPQPAPAAWRQWSTKQHDWDYQTDKGDLRPDTPAEPLFVAAAQPAPAAVPPGYALVPIEPTPEMLDAYLNANDEYWKRADELPPSLFKWRNGTPKDATVESYRAMIAAAGDKT